MAIGNNWYDLVIKFMGKAKDCLTENPLESIELLNSAKQFALEAKQNLPEEYQVLYNAALEGGAKQHLLEAKNGMLNNKPGDVLRYLNSALSYASEVRFKLHQEDLEEVVDYLYRKDARPNYIHNLTKYKTKLGLD